MILKTRKKERKKKKKKATATPTHLPRNRYPQDFSLSGFHLGFIACGRSTPPPPALVA